MDILGIHLEEDIRRGGHNLGGRKGLVGEGGCRPGTVAEDHGEASRANRLNIGNESNKVDL